MLEACSKLLKANPRTDDQILELSKHKLKGFEKKLKTQCCYKKDTSYEAVRSRKFDRWCTDRYIFKFLTKFYGISCYFLRF